MLATKCRLLAAAGFSFMAALSMAGCRGASDAVDPGEEESETALNAAVTGAESPTPILISVTGKKFDLTNAAGGVSFDIDNDATMEQVSWTTANSDDAFLVLDRNGNGTIDNGAELFGDVTPQPASPTPNGFLALAEYDKPANGGDGNGIINVLDAIFTSLRLWQDTNHNGISEASELKTLQTIGVRGIDLAYKVSSKKDKYGNQFRYRSKVYSLKKSGIGKTAFDVILIVQ